MKTRLLLTFFLAVALSGYALASDQKHIELEYNSQNSPLQIPLKEGSTLSIGSDGNVSATADDSFACNIDCPVCTPCENVQVDLNSFTVNNNSSATVAQNKSVVFKWNSRGAYACDGSGLPNTTWNTSKNKFPINTGGLSVNVGELEPDDYVVGIHCFNGPVMKSRFVTVTVVEEVGVPEGCEGVAPAHLTRASYCVHNDSGRDCYFYDQVFGGQFPGTMNASQYRQGRNQFTSMQFTTKSDMPPNQEGQWSVTEPKLATGLPQGGSKIWTISTCPGDFDRQRVEADMNPGCYRRTGASSSIRWGGENTTSDHRCRLEPGKTYYLNLVMTTSDDGVNPDEIEWGCGDGNDVCGNSISPVFTN